MFTKTPGNLTGIALATAAAGMFASADVSAVGGHSAAGGHSGTGGHSVANSHSLNSCRGHGFVGHSACRTVVNSCRTHFISCHTFHRHFRSTVVIIGAPFFAPFYYPAPYYYYPPVAAMPYSSPQYIEQGEAAPEQSQAYWYYCADAKAYYPYVKDCPGGWQRVMPQAPPASNY